MSKIYNFLTVSDKRLLHLINTKFKSNMLDKLIPLITNIGSAVFTLILTFLLIIFGSGKIRAAGVESFLTLFFSSICVTYLKNKFTRPRPYWVIKELNSFNIMLKDYSFPSGHTTAAFSLATVLSINFPGFMFLFISIALIVGFSRVYLAVHFPTDVIMGMVIGVSFGLINTLMIHPNLIYKIISLNYRYFFKS